MAAACAAASSTADTRRRAIGRAATCHELASGRPLAPARAPASRVRGTPEWLEGQGVTLPEPNRARARPTARWRSGSRRARCCCWRPADPAASLIDRLDAAWPQGRDAVRPHRAAIPVPRADSHFWFLLTGRHVPAMLAKLCGIDLRIDRFAPLEVAQTQAVRLSVIIIRDDTRPARLAPARRQRQCGLCLDLPGRRDAGVRREAGRPGRAVDALTGTRNAREQG